MRRNILAGVLMALAFLIPAAPALAQTESPGLDKDCQTVERKVYADIRTFVTIDLDTAPVGEVRVLAARILAEATANSLPILKGAVQQRLNGTDSDLRSFLKTDMKNAWTVDLRNAVARTLTGAGANVQAAAQKALGEGTIDAYLAYLNNGLYDARARDCASPSASASTSPSPSVPAAASVSPSAAGGVTLPVTGANTSFLALGASALILFGVGGVLVARRSRT
jgi:Short repeats of unknown function